MSENGLHGFWNYSLMVSCLHINEKVWSCVLMYLRTIGREWRSLQPVENKLSKQADRTYDEGDYIWSSVSLRRSRSWSYLCFFSFLWSVLVCILLCPPTHTCLCIWGESLPEPSSSVPSSRTATQIPPSHRIGGPTPFHPIFWALGYSRQPAMLGV